MTSSTIHHDLIVPEVSTSTKMDSLDHGDILDGDISDAKWKEFADSIQIFDPEMIKQYKLRQSCKPKFLERFFSSEKATRNLRIATKLGKTDLVNLLLELGRAYVNDSDKAGKTALHYAAREGHLEIVNMLLVEKDIDPSLRDGDGNTALHIATKHGHVLVLDKLLNNPKVDKNSTNDQNETPLILAIKRGHEKIVDKLLDEPSVVVTSEDQKIIALHAAVERGHVIIVENLLEKMNYDNSTTYLKERSPLHLAIKCGHETVVDVLLKKENMKHPWKDSSGNTPFHIAAKKGNGNILERLLEKACEEDVISCNEEGMTPLHVATKYNHANIVTILLENSKLDPCMKTTKGETPLCMASKFGAADVVQVLLATREVDVNITDSKKRTAIRWASKRRHSNVVDVLLTEPNVNPWLGDDSDNTPLHFAAKYGHRDIVKRLLAKSPLDVVNKVNKQKETPLLLAARHGFEDVVDLLFQNPEVDLSICDENGDSPFRAAVKGGHVNIAEKLIPHLKAMVDDSKVNLSSKDAYGNFPIHYAAQMGNTSILQMIVEAGVDVNSVNDHRDTALHIAVRKGHVKVVEELLKASKILANMRDGDGNCPLHVAALYDEEEMIERLLEAGVDVNVENEDGVPALVLAAQEGHVIFVDELLKNLDLKLVGEKEGLKTDWGVCSLLHAAHNGHDKVIKSLLDHNVNVNGSVHPTVQREVLGTSPRATPGFRHDTALSEAIENGRKRVVKELLQASSIDSNRRNQNGEHPLFIAARHGHLEIIEMLLGKKPSDVNAISSGGTTLQGAMQEGRKKVTKTLPKIPKIDVNVISNGKTTLQGAARAGREQVVKTLLNIPEIDVHFRNPSNGETALFDAARANNKTILKDIYDKSKANVGSEKNRIQSRLDIDDKNVQGVAIIHVAAQDKLLNVLDFLVDVKRDDVSSVNVNLETSRPKGKKEKFIPQSALEIAIKEAIKAAMEAAIMAAIKAKLDKFVEKLAKDSNNQIKRIRQEERGQVHASNPLQLSIRVAEDTPMMLQKMIAMEAEMKATKGTGNMKDIIKDIEEQNGKVIEKFLQKFSKGVQKQEGDMDAKISLQIAKKAAEEAEEEANLLANEKAERYKVIEKLTTFNSISFIQEEVGQKFLQHIYDEKQWETFSIVTRAPQVADYIEALYKDRQASVDAANAILVGAALIAGVTFASWLQPPLGYSTYYHEQFSDSLPAPPVAYPEYVAFDHHPSLQAFWVFNSLSFFSAIATVISGARSVLPAEKVFIKKEVKNLQWNLIKTSMLLGLSMFFVLLAFATAGVVVLPPVMKFRANIFSTIGIGGSLCFVSLFLFGKSICKLVYIYNESSETKNLGFFRQYFTHEGWTNTYSNIKSSITNKMVFFRRRFTDEG